MIEYSGRDGDNGEGVASDKGLVSRSAMKEERGRLPACGSESSEVLGFDSRFIQESVKRKCPAIRATFGMWDFQLGKSSNGDGSERRCFFVSTVERRA